MDNRPIGFFDSGVGGLTCVRALQKLLPNERVVFFGDTARTPYGSKSPETIKRFSFQIVDYLMQYDVKMIVIACNTISATCLDALRERYPQVPIVGIIEPIANKIVAEVTEDVEIGVIATKATVKSGVYEKLIRPRNEHVKLYSKACPVLVPLIEEGIVDNEIMDLTLKHYLDDFIRDNHLKKLVLGCTHYPFLKKNFGRIYPEIDLLNPSKEVIVAEIYPDFDGLKAHGIEDAKAYFAEEIKKINQKNVSYKTVGLVKIRETEFPKNTSRKITRFAIDKSID